MARAKVKTENNDVIISDGGVQLVSPDLEAKLTNNLANKKENDEVVQDLGEVSLIEVEQPKVFPVKMTKILMACTHKCYVGGEWYYLLEGKQYNVPENVKEILLRANKLKPL